MKLRQLLPSIALALPGILLAETIYVDIDATGAGTGDSWQDAISQLEDAIAQAQAGDEIWVAQGVYSPAGSDRTQSFTLKTDVYIYGGFVGSETHRNDRDADPATNATTLSGNIGDPQTNADNLYHVVNATGVSNAILDGFTIRDGNANLGPTANTARGGGLICTNGGSPYLRNLRFVDNQASYVGGAIYLNAAAPIIQLVDFINNQTSSTTTGGVYGEGGAVYLNLSPTTFNYCTFVGNSGRRGGAVSLHTSNVTFQNCDFADNVVNDDNDGGLGGAIYTDANSKPIVTRSTFTSNAAQFAGGAIYTQYTGAGEIRDTTFEENSAGDNGGAITMGSSPLVIQRSTFRLNTASDRGAAIYASLSAFTLTDSTFVENLGASDCDGGALYLGSSDALINNCLFLGNYARIGGAIASYNNAYEAQNCVFLGNQARNLGGGVFHFNTQATLVNCSFSGNEASLFNGGAVRTFQDSTTLENSIIWNNSEKDSTTAPGASIFHESPVDIQIASSLIEHSGGSASWNIAFGADLGGNLDVDPLFATPADPLAAPNTVGDLHLLQGSPAINTGRNSFNSTSEDVAGQPRISDGIIDLGTYEGGFVTYAFFGYTDPEGDSNQNGQSNYMVYAMGGDPTAPDNPMLRPQISKSQLTYTLRNNALDATVRYERSPNLENWTFLIEGVHYTLSSVDAGDYSIYTLQLLDPYQFFRLIYETPES